MLRALGSAAERGLAHRTQPCERLRQIRTHSASERLVQGETTNGLEAQLGCADNEVRRSGARQFLDQPERSIWFVGSGSFQENADLAQSQLGVVRVDPEPLLDPTIQRVDVADALQFVELRVEDPPIRGCVLRHGVEHFERRSRIPTVGELLTQLQRQGNVGGIAR